MMKRISIILFFIGLVGVPLGCGPKRLTYPYLSSPTHPYYESLSRIDLKGEEVHFIVKDRRYRSGHFSCSRASKNLEPVVIVITPTLEPELMGEIGIEYFLTYLRGLIEYSHGSYEPSTSSIEIDLEVLSSEITGVGYLTVTGMVQFTVRSETLNRTYCAAIQDGDPEAPLGRFSFATRKGAERKLLAAAVRAAIEDFLKDWSNQ